MGELLSSIGNTIANGINKAISPDKVAFFEQGRWHSFRSENGQLVEKHEPTRPQGIVDVVQGGREFAMRRAHFHWGKIVEDHITEPDKPMDEGIDEGMDTPKPRQIPRPVVKPVVRRIKRPMDTRRQPLDNAYYLSPRAVNISGHRPIQITPPGIGKHGLGR